MMPTRLLAHRVTVFIAVFCFAVVLATSAASAGRPPAPAAPFSPANLPNPLTIAGSPIQVIVAADSSIQVFADGYGQVYGWQDGSADSGAWLRVGGELFGPDACYSGRLTTSLFNVRPWTGVSHVGPAGAGTAGDPWVITTVLDAGSTGVRITQRVSYVNGQPYFRLQWDVANLSPGSQEVSLYHAVDSYYGNNDNGRGYYDAASGAVGSYYTAGGSWYMLFAPSTAATGYQEGRFDEIWAAMGYCGDNMTCPVSGGCTAGPGFNNTLDTSPAGSDNGFGLQWERTLGAWSSATVGDWWTFGSNPVLPGASTPTPSATVPPSPSPSPSATVPPSPTLTATVTPGATWTPSPTPSPTRTPGGCGEVSEAGTVVRTLAYHQLTNLTPNGVWDTARGAMLSADGARAAFVMGSDPTRFYVMNVDGPGAPLQIDTRSGAEGVNAAEVGLSADGSRVMTVGAEKDYWVVRVANADGSSLRPVLTLGRYLTFRLSADGTQVFFQNPEDFDFGGARRLAGLYAVSVASPGQLRKIVDRSDVGSLLGVDAAGIWFAGGSYNHFAASHDGSRFIFSVTASYRNARVLHVNGDGSGLAEYAFPGDYFWHVENLGISGDGSKVFYLGQKNPCCSSPYELSATGFGGGARTVLSDYGGGNTDRFTAQLSYDGARLYYLSRLYNTDGSGQLDLALPGPGAGGDPPSIVNGSRLFGASPNDSATRFLYRTDYGASQPLQLGLLELNPPGLGAAPAMTQPKIVPAYVLANGSTASTVSAGVSTGQTLVRVNGVALRDGVDDATVLNGGTLLLDDGTQGDLASGDGVFTSNRVWASTGAALGPRTLRLRAEVRAGDGRRHSTAIDVAQLDVVTEVPAGFGTCTPTPTPTRTLTATATWTSTFTPTATSSPTRTPSPTYGLPDLTVSRLEVNQAIQNDANSIPLIAAKRTVVRVTLGVVASTPLTAVTGQLRGYRGGTLLGAVAPFNPGGRISPPPAPDWRRLNDTLNFELPFAWLNGDLRLEVEVNGDRAVPESNYGNNTAALTVRFVDGGDLRIAWFPIHYVAPGWTGPADPSSRIAKGQAWLVATYPVSHTRVKYYPWPGITWDGDINVEGNEIKLLQYVERLLQLSQTAPKPDHVYGWLPPSLFWGNGLGRFPGRAAYGNDTDGRWRRTFTHEIGHNDDLGHWNAMIGQHGFDVAAREVREDTRYDFMVPARLENEAWIAPGQYVYLHNRIVSAAAQAADAAGPTAAEYLLVSGVVKLDGTATFDAFYRQLQADPLDNPPVGADYCLEIFDGAANKLASRCFDVDYGFGDGTAAMTAAPFALTLSFPPTARQITLAHKGTTLATRTISPAAPSIAATIASAGAVKTVSWTASDPDGGPLSYSVLYSADNKANWYAVATGLAGTSYSLDTSTFPGGANAYVRVLASDGVNTGQSDAGPFAVAGKPPVALIQAPADGASYVAGETVLLIGDGVDLEDGALPDARLVWSSDRDGAFGVGRTVETYALSAGTHAVTLTVTDNEGNDASASVTVEIVRGGTWVYLPLVLKR